MNSPTLAPFFGGGQTFVDAESELMEKDYNGPVGERVEILLKKPQRKAVTIEAVEDINTPERAVVADVTANNRYSFRSHVVGTINDEKVQVRTRTASRPRHFCGLAFRNRLRATPTDIATLKKYTFHCVDLKDIFTSDCRSSAADSGNVIEVRCVVQQKQQNGSSRFRFENGILTAGDKFGGLGSKGNQYGEEEEICRMIRTRLPPELRTDILKYLNYDQVKWLADGDERFARKLANRRYGVNSYDLNRFPNLSKLVPVLRKKAAGEMRFGPDEDLWIVSIGGEYYSTDSAVRYAVRPGVYKWHTALSATRVRYDANRSYCEFCTENLYDLQQSMAENQVKTVQGTANIKVFALEGCEDTAIDMRYASPFFHSANASSNYDYAVHMWTENLDNAWLQDVQVRGENLQLREFNTFAGYNTLIFKDPVKFLGTSKIMDVVDEGIRALTSKLDGQVVGYLVDDKEFGLRVPRRQDEAAYGNQPPPSPPPPPQITGLNFMSSSHYKELHAANNLVKHVRCHETKRKINIGIERLRDLRARLADNGIDENDAAAVTAEIVEISVRLQRFYNILYGSEKIRSLEIVQETANNVVHFHEILEDDFDFCTIYLFYQRKNMQKSIKQIVQMLETCSYELQNPDKACTLKSINPMALRSVYAVKTGKTLDI